MARKEKRIELLGIAILVAVLLVWLAASLWAMIRIRVFTSTTFAAAPIRVHQPSFLVMTLLAILGITVLYIALLILTGSQVNLTQLQELPEGLAIVMLLDGLCKALAAGVMLPLIAATAQNGLDGVGLSLRKLPRGIALGLLAALIILPTMYLVQAGSGLIGQWIRGGEPPPHPVLLLLAKHPTPLARFILITTACLVAPLMEEIYFRGLLQNACMRLAVLMRPVAPAPDLATSPAIPAQPPESTQTPILSYYSQSGPGAWSITNRSRWMAIASVAFLFALIHFDPGTHNFEVLPPLFLLALTLGYLYERTGNLWASITLHAAFNTINTIAFLSGHP